MDDLLTFERFSELKGTEVRSADDAKIGSVNALFCDEQTDEPEWIGLGTGFLGMKEAVVPVNGARVDGKRTSCRTTGTWSNTSRRLTRWTAF